MLFTKHLDSKTVYLSNSGVTTLFLKGPISNNSGVTKLFLKGPSSKNFRL